MEKLKEEIKKLNEERSSKILELGEIKYAEIRNMVVDEESLDGIVEEIRGIDRKIYLKKEEINKLEGNKAECPNCGTKVEGTFKFCKSCGANVEGLGGEEEDREEVGNCSICENTLYKGENFCTACGMRI